MSSSQHGHCRDLLQDLNDYIDGELDETLCSELERHMRECENCRVVVDTLRKTVLLYNHLPAQPAPDALEARLFKCLDLEAFLAAPAAGGATSL
ncbi:MAG: zf-HC2 domain-containing protein [Caldilineales bacterium]